MISLLSLDFVDLICLKFHWEAPEIYRNNQTLLKRSLFIYVSAELFSFVAISKSCMIMMTTMTHFVSGFIFICIDRVCPSVWLSTSVSPKPFVQNSIHFLCKLSVAVIQSSIVVKLRYKYTFGFVDDVAFAMAWKGVWGQLAPDWGRSVMSTIT